MITIIESVDNYNIGDVVHLKADVFQNEKHKGKDVHPFIILSRRNGKYHGVLVSHSGKDWSQNFNFNETDIPGLEPGKVKTDNIAWFSDEDIDNKRSEISPEFLEKIFSSFKSFDEQRKKNRDFLECFDLFEKYVKVLPIKEYLQQYFLKEDDSMSQVKYKISFKYDMSEIDDNDSNVEIDDVDDMMLFDIFKTPEKINEFQNWFNENDPTPINVINIEGDQIEDGFSYIITLAADYEDNQYLGESLVDYVFESDNPVLDVHFTGVGYEDKFDPTTQHGHYQVDKPYDYNDKITVYNYTNLTIEKL